MLTLSHLTRITITFFIVAVVIGTGAIRPASAATTTLPGDFNNDGVVNIIDLSIFLTKWNANASAEDLDNNGTVGNSDLSILIGNYGKSGGVSGGGTSCAVATANLPDGPDPWGTCWPGQNNTGVHSGVSLAAVSGDLTVSSDGAVVSGKNVSGCIIVESAGVTIKNSKAKCITNASSAHARDPANPPLIIQDSEIDCGNVLGSTAIMDKNIRATRVNIHGCENGFDMDSNATITDSYIHDLYNSAVGDPHTDGLQSGVGSYLTLTHNVFYGFDTGCSYPNDGSCNGTSAVNIFNAATGPTVYNTTVSKNLLAGGAYSLYCPRVSTINFQILDNRFSQVYSPHVGEFGPSSDCADESQSGNVINESNEPLPLE